MNLREQRDAALKAARELADSFGNDVSSEQLAELKAATDKVDEIDRRIDSENEKAAVIDRLKSMNFDSKSGKGAEPEAAKSLGEHFVKSASDRLASQAAGSRMEFSTPEFSKAAADPAKPPAGLADGWGTEYSRSIVNQRRERLVVADLMGSATVTLPTIKYLVEKSKRIVEGAPATVAVAGAKPYVRFDDFDVVTESLSKIAALTKLADEMVEDYGFVADWINNQLIYELSVVEEQQLLNGDGAGSNLTGLLNRDGVQTHTAADGKWFDGLFEAQSKIPLATNLTADGIMVNPADYQKLRLSKDANGQYLAGGPFTGQYGNGGIMIDPPVWGLRTVVTQAVPKGTAVVGAFRQGATVLRKGGLRVDSTNTNDKDFENNLVTLRAEERVGLMVPLPAAFVKVTLEGESSGELGS